MAIDGRDVRTLLLTDIEGSTGQWERDPEVMGAAVTRHDEIVREVVEAAGGRFVKHKGEGDSTFSVFTSPLGAVAAAVDLQRAMVAERWPTSTPLRVRVGVHTGEIEVRDGDYYGRTVNRAARLRGLAVGATIVTTASTLEGVARDLDDGVTLVDLGRQELRGVIEAEHVVAVGHPDLPDPREALAYLQRRAGPALPAALRLHGDRVVVGRDRELAGLADVWSATLAGRATLGLVRGEPGVGKTRLVAAVAERVSAGGGLVLYGRCDESPHRSYQPLAEGLAGEIERLAPNEAEELFGDLAPELSLVVPELRSLLGDRSSPVAERIVMFRAVATALSRLALDRGALVVVDDLQWADEASLALLEHVLRQRPDAPLLFVGTYRESDLGANPALVRSIVGLRRGVPIVEVGLEGLGRDDVVRLLGDEHRQHLDEVVSASDGNPFFVLELRDALDQGETGVPLSVRQSVADRVGRLPLASQRFVEAAAVVGLDVEVRLVVEAAGVQVGDVVAAVTAGLLADVPDDPGRVRFAHALVRSAVLDGTAAVEQAELHRRVAAAIEAAEAGRLDEVAGRLAHHHRSAGARRADGPAYAWSMRAGRHAGRLLAYEEAERHQRNAIEIATADDAPAARIAAELELAEVLARSGRPATGHALAQAAALAARDIGAPELVGWATFTTCFGQPVGLPGNLETIRDARGELVADDPWSGPLDIVLAAELMQRGEVDAGAELIRTTTARAAAAGDAVLLALARIGEAMFIDRLAVTVDEILAAIPRSDGPGARSVRLSAPVLRVQAESMRIGHLVTGGDVVAARTAAAEFAARYGDETGIAEANIPLFAMTDGLLSGEWDRWRGQLERFRGNPELASVYGTHLLGSEMMQTWVTGRLGGSVELIASLPSSMMFARPALALALGYAGRIDDAREVVSACASGDGLESRARTVIGRTELAFLGYAVPMTGDREVASRIYDLLLPRRGQVVAWAGWAFWGAVDSVLGLLAESLGRGDLAVEHHEAALALNDRAGWRVLSAVSSADLAVALRARAGPGDVERATALAATASAEARALGIGAVDHRLAGRGGG